MCLNHCLLKVRTWQHDIYGSYLDEHLIYDVFRLKVEKRLKKQAMGL